MIASAIAGIPGASRVLTGGVVCYGSSVKHQLLGISADIIQDPGVLSEPCAKQMAAGVQLLLGTDVAVSATGLAGPGGGTLGTPVGTVFVGVVGQGSPTATRLYFHGGRLAVRRKAAKQALFMLLETIGCFDIALAKQEQI